MKHEDRGAQHAEPGERERRDRHARHGGIQTAAWYGRVPHALEACADE